MIVIPGHALVLSSTNAYKQAPAIARRWPGAPAGFRTKPCGRCRKQGACVVPLLPPAASPHLRVGRPGFHHIVPQLAPDGLRREAWGGKNNQPGAFTPSPRLSALPQSSQGRWADKGQRWGVQTQTPAAKGRCFAARGRAPPFKGRESKMAGFVGPHKEQSYSGAPATV